MELLAGSGGALGGADPIRGLCRDKPWNVAISSMRRGDIPSVIALLNPIPEVCYCEWEDADLLGLHVARDNRHFNFAAHSDEGVVGALIGGSVGVRGTISHVAVADGWRRCGVGATLVQKCLASFEGRGIRRIFVFTEDRNEIGSTFWDEMGFSPTIGETTWERDL